MPRPLSPGGCNAAILDWFKRARVIGSFDDHGAPKLKELKFTRRSPEGVLAISEAARNECMRRGFRVCRPVSSLFSIVLLFHLIFYQLISD